MSAEGFRRACLHGLLVILVGMLIAGFPLTWVVTRDAYHQSIPINPGGDYRGWLMAHLEGILNGLLVIAIASACRYTVMSARWDRVLLWSLLIAAWGNIIASIMAPIFGVRGMALDGNIANNLVVAIFTIALVATFAAFGIALLHLRRRSPQVQPST